MKERPILFSGEMVKAILDGRKTMTRRVAIPRQDDRKPCEHWSGYNADATEGTARMTRHCQHGSEGRGCPYGLVGDVLWVRETWATPASYDHMRPSDCDRRAPLYYHADQSHGVGSAWIDEDQELGRLRPSIHMPRWASRITLEVTAVRVERVRDIKASDVAAEGLLPKPPCAQWLSDFTAARDFGELWDSINGARPGCAWADNPWVWVVAFRRVTP